MIIAGDIGGTKTNLALFVEEEGNYIERSVETFPSKNYSSLQSIVGEFLEKCKEKGDFQSLHTASFAVAGPIVENVCRTTNLPWVIDAHELSRVLNIENVYLINDLEANAWAIEILSQEHLLQIHPGHEGSQGNRAVTSPGTGLGEAGLYWTGSRHYPFASEGGHCEFGPRNELQIDLCRYLLGRFGHASYERILSGPGLYNIYLFYKEVMGREEPSWLFDELAQTDPAKVITLNGLNQKSELCLDALNLFVAILGAEASNCALKFMAKGGVYLGGGIPPKILPKLKEPVFFEGFLDKGRFRSFLERIPIHVILDEKASLKGAAHYCRQAQNQQLIK